MNSVRPSFRLLHSPASLLALTLALLLPLLASCSTRDAVNAALAAASGDPAQAFASLARSKAVSYASNPLALARDVERFVDAVDALWGSEAQAPTPKQYVKYTQGYRARARVDFDAGLVVVETVDASDTLESLRRAVATTLLTPADPRAVDLYSAGPVTLGGTPFLYREVLDRQGRPIADAAHADRLARDLVLTRLEHRRTAGGTDIWFVVIPMVPDHLHIRAAKYAGMVSGRAARFNVSPSLIYAIMEVESDFNPFAVSRAGALGLMQVVPTSAGADVCRLLEERACVPAPEVLMQAGANITYGTAYLHLLETRHFGRVLDPAARDMAVVAAYNGGPGAVARVFASSRQRAVEEMNRLGPAGVMAALKQGLPTRETRRYLDKVFRARKHYVNVD